MKGLGYRFCRLVSRGLKPYFFNLIKGRIVILGYNATFLYEVLGLVYIARTPFFSLNASEAIKIQATFRGHLGRGQWRRAYRVWKRDSRAATVIQRVRERLLRFALVSMTRVLSI